jgi:selenocysteine lyase/cysteine desulfurase
VAQIWLAQRPRGARVTSVPDPNGEVPVDDYLAAIDERTALVSMPIISYRTGALMPVAQVVRRAREVGARVFVDAYQVAGVLPVDVTRLGCDYLVSGTMKYLLGIPGIAYLYARAGLADDLSPQLTGWYGRGAALSFDPQALDYPDDARRFQMNMPTLAAALAANAGLGLIGELDLDAVRRHVYGLVDRTLRRLAESGTPVYSPTAAAIRGPQVAVLDDDPMKLAAWLNARRIFPARGHVVRMSFHYYNDESDVDTACAALAEYRGSP